MSNNQQYQRYHNEDDQENPFSQNQNTLVQAQNNASAAQVIKNQGVQSYLASSLVECTFNERQGFIVKVFGIVIFQLLVTFLLVVWTICSPSMQNFLFDKEAQTMNAPFWIAFSIAIAIELLLFCFQSLGRKVPINYILLFTFTVMFSTTVCVPCCLYAEVFSNGIILIIAALSLTILATVILTLYALFTKTDFTLCGGVLWLFAFTLFAIIVLSCFYSSLILELIICGCCIIVYGFYLVYDVQLISGGHQYGLSVDDYILGAMIIYIDIVVLFLRILECLAIIFGKN